jgi:hypothetical protein
MRKSEPENALRKVGKWRNERMEARRNGKKVVGGETLKVSAGNESVAAGLEDGAESD